MPQPPGAVIMAQDTMSVFYCHCCFETGAHYVVQAGLKLKSSCLSLLSAGITSVCNHFLNMTLFNFEILPFVFLVLKYPLFAWCNGMYL